jgi:hypothetical protein
MVAPTSAPPDEPLDISPISAGRDRKRNGLNPYCGFTSASLGAGSSDEERRVSDGAGKRIPRLILAEFERAADFGSFILPDHDLTHVAVAVPDGDLPESRSPMAVVRIFDLNRFDFENGDFDGAVDDDRLGRTTRELPFRRLGTGGHHGHRAENDNPSDSVLHTNTSNATTTVGATSAQFSISGTSRQPCIIRLSDETSGRTNRVNEQSAKMTIRPVVLATRLR